MVDNWLTAAMRSVTQRPQHALTAPLSVMQYITCKAHQVVHINSGLVTCLALRDHVGDCAALIYIKPIWGNAECQHVLMWERAQCRLWTSLNEVRGQRSNKKKLCVGLWSSKEDVCVRISLQVMALLTFSFFSVCFCIDFYFQNFLYNCSSFKTYFSVLSHSEKTSIWWKGKGNFHCFSLWAFWRRFQNYLCD